MLIENETKNIFDKRLLKNKIPKCKKSAKNIPFPNSKCSKNSKALLPTRQSSTMTLKENTNLSQKYPSDNNFQIFTKNNIFSSFQKGLKNKIPKFNFNNRQNSWEKSKIKKNDDSFNKIKIEQIHNYKIQYLLLKEKIKNFSDKDNISLDIKNKIIREISIKLNLILKKSNDYLEEQKQENENQEQENNNDIENNKKLLKIYTDNYNKWNARLKEISNTDYISNLNDRINEIDKEINIYEVENDQLLLNNYKNDLVLPNIQKINKIENDSILDRQLQNKIIEYKDKIGQEIAISKKIKDNEINIKKLDEIINDLNEKSKEYIDNSKYAIFSVENNINSDFFNINKGIFKFNKKRKFNKLNELIMLRNENKSNNLNNTTTQNKESTNRIITSENQSNIEENIYMLPFTTKRKNLSCSNIALKNKEAKSNNNRTMKEIILQNLDLKEKEEKALINVYEKGENSQKKYKHIKLKPNFSFTNDYHKFKDDNINKYQKLQSSAEIANIKNNEDANNNKEDLIKESVVDEASNKLEIQNIASMEKNSKFNRNKRLKDISMEPIKKIFKENNKVNTNIENKKERFSTTTEQREKVLNTIMYDDL